MWSPLNGSTPAGWAECDGTANSPGPDLRNRFVVGRGTKTVDTIGGAATHIHTAHSGVLAHDHDQMRHATTTGALSGLTTAPDTSSSNPQVLGPKTGSTGSGSSYTHDGPNHEPPWYALIYIQRMT